MADHSESFNAEADQDHELPMMSVSIEMQPPPRNGASIPENKPEEESPQRARAASPEKSGDEGTVATATATLADSLMTNGMNQKGEIWYFAYGPVVHPQVRLRRNLNATEIQPAILSDHRLTFAFGGAVTVVPSTGFTVHGVLMKVDNEETWEKIKSDDSGYAPQDVQVYPYKRGELDMGAEEEFFEEHTPVHCNAFIFLDEFDENIMESDQLQQMEKKPQERYLRLIAQGMMQAGVLPDYVEDEILAVPFIPTRKEEEWLVFPNAKGKKRLPKITFEKYQALAEETISSQEIYFILHNHVLRVYSTLPDIVNGKSGQSTAASNWNSNAMVQMMKMNAHGKPDVTHLSHVLVADPAVPWAPTADEMTDIHYRWCENLWHDYFSTSDLAAEKVYQLVESKKKKKGNKPGIWAKFFSSCKAEKVVDPKSGIPKQVVTKNKSPETTSNGSQDNGDDKKQVVELNDVERQVTRLTAEKAGREGNAY